MDAKAIAALVAVLFVVQILTLTDQMPESYDGQIEASGSSLPGGSFDTIPDIDYGTQYLVESISVDDLNGDGANDLLFGGWNSQGGGFEIHMQTAPGVFNFQPDIMVQASPSMQGHYTNTVADALDCNGDGLNDVAAAGWWNGIPRAAMYTQSAGPSFGFSYYMNPSYPRSIEAADVNNDGLTDITLGDPYNGYIDIYLQKPGTGFNAIADQRVVLHMFWPHSLIEEYTLSDLNGDGRLDLVLSYVEMKQDPYTGATSEIGDKVAIFHQPSVGWPQVDPNYLTPETVPDVVLVEFIEDPLSHIEGLGVGDFNSDGHDDVAVLVSEYGVGIDIRIFRYDADIGEVSSALSQSISIQQSEIYNLAHHMKDLNQDGRVDLLFGHPVSVYFQTADGLISQNPGFTTNVIADRGLAIADLDQDRDNDIIAADGTGYCIWFDHALPPPLTIHEVLKGAQSPRASAVSWEYAPAEYGTWNGHIVNNGLRSLLVDVYDVTTGVPEQVMHQRIRFSAQGAYPSGEVNTLGVEMSPVHRYLVTVTPNGPQGSSCSVEDRFLEAVPVAMFTLEVQRASVFVNASDSYDPDGTIVSYDWTFGDGGSGSGITVTHTYFTPGVYEIILTVTDSDGLSDSKNAIVTIEDQALTAHDPILIGSDADFTPENGVVSGSGTASDPYVIADWDINASTAAGVEIRGTTAYYVLRHLNIHSGAAIQPYLHEGMRLDNARNGRVEYVETHNNMIDLDIRSSSNIVIANNNFTNDFSGTVYLTSCSSIELYNNTFVTDYGGIVVQYTSSVTAKGNSFNAQGFSFWGSLPSHFDTHVISPDNTVAGEPVIYIAHGQDIVLDGGQAAQVIAASSTRVAISGLDLSHVSQGVVLAYVTDSVVESCTLTSDSNNCVKLYYCDNVTLTGNVISNSYYYAVETISSSRVDIKDNTVANCGHSYGIVIRFNSPESLIENNTAYGNFAAVLLYQAHGGVRLLNNNLSSNDIGIFISGATGFEVARNTIAMNAHEGIRFESGSTSNVFHHNNMLSNAAQVVGETAGANKWDDGYPSGGNYWNDYQGVDDYGGAGQTEPGSDGIGDTPYVVSSGSQDRYPLMEPWTPEPIEYVSHDPITIVGDADFTAENGVVGGNGTMVDPYVIQGWMIDAHNSSDGILISKTTAYFVVDNVLVYKAGESRAGVTVSNAKHGQVENVVARDCYVGIVVIGSEDILVHHCLSYSNVYHGVLVSNSNRVDVTNNTLRDQMIGVFIDGQGANGTISANTIYNCEMGIYADFVSAVNISGNLISSCSAAVILGEASECTVSENVIKSCVGPMGAIYLRYDTNCTVNGNSIELTEQNGICILDSDFITLTGNTVARGGGGIFLIGFSGSGNGILVTGNVVMDNFHGLQISDVGSALIYGNDIVNNTYQAYQGNSNVTWDYLGSGNYWSDYIGLDSNGDGIGDTPYQVPGGGVDNHPLIAPCTV